MFGLPEVEPLGARVGHEGLILPTARLCKLHLPSTPPRALDAAEESPKRAHRTAPRLGLGPAQGPGPFAGETRHEGAIESSPHRVGVAQ